MIELSDTLGLSPRLSMRRRPLQVADEVQQRDRRGGCEVGGRAAVGKFVAKAPFWREIGSPCIEMRKYNHHHSFSSSSCVGRNEESVNDFYGVIFNNGRTSLPRYLHKARCSEEILTLYAEQCPLFSVVPFLILPLSVKHAP